MTFLGEESKKVVLRFSLVFSVLLFCLLSIGMKASAEENSVELKESEINEWIEKENKSEESLKTIPFDKGSEFLLLHNNGNEIKNDVIQDDTDFYLEAVTKEVINGVEVIGYYFNHNDNENRDLKSIEKAVEEVVQNTKMENLIKTEEFAVQNNIISPTVAGNDYVIKNYSWNFNNSAHYVTTSVELSRKSKNASINGTSGSVWDVITNTQYERKSGLRYLNYLSTKLAVPYSSQLLLDWGPSSTNSSSVTVSLSGYVPGVSYTFNTGVAYNTTDNSSKSSKVGSWKFSRAVYPVYANKLTTRPAIRATNTSGYFTVQLSHSLVFDNVTNNTGIIYVSTPDR